MRRPSSRLNRLVITFGSLVGIALAAFGNANKAGAASVPLPRWQPRIPIQGVRPSGKPSGAYKSRGISSAARRRRTRARQNRKY